MEPSFSTRDLPSDLSQAIVQAAWQGEGFHPLPPGASASPLTPAQRLLGVARVWAEARFGFAYWDQLPALDWDTAFGECACRALAAADDGAYWETLMDFAALLRDGHTEVYPPAELRAPTNARPPLELGVGDGLPTVLRSAGAAAEAGFAPGVAITQVDGRPAAERMAAVGRRIAVSTEHFRIACAAQRLLAGPAGSDVELAGETVDGRTVRARLTRETAGARPQPPAVQRRELDPGVWLVSLRTFGDDGVPGEFDALFPDFEGVRALILDLRANGGGSTGIGYGVLGRLIDSPAAGSAVRLRTYVPTFRAWGRPQASIAVAGMPAMPSDRLPRFGGPVAVLTGPWTASAAEDFLVAWRSARRGPVVGEPTCGSTGQPLFVALPGGGTFRVCTKRDTYPDGTTFVGLGILPDVPAAPTRRGMAAGRDEVLAAALHALGVA